MSRSEAETTVEKWVYGGHGLSREDGRVVLTPLVLPGERIVVEQVDKLHARLLEIKEPSPVRVAAPCPYFGVCGGCQYQHAPYAYQVEQKREILREVVRRIGKFEAPEEIRTVTGPEWQYRNRTQLHVRDGRTGYLRMGSHELCAVDHCPISSPKLNEAIGILARLAGDRRFPPFVRTVELFTNEREIQFNVISTERPVARHFFDWIAQELPGYAPGAIEYGGFRVGPRSFFQVNRFLVDSLIEAAVAPASGDSALDLYAGAGLFTRALTATFGQVAAVEASASAVADLKHNVPGARAIRADVAEYMTGLEQRPDFVLADPAREGLGKHVVRELLRVRPARLHLVACDPATMSRDVRVLLEGGYRIEGMTLIDLFPQTYHFETVVTMITA